MGAFLRTALIVLLYALVSGSAAWVGAEWASRVLDGCTGPSVDCGYEKALGAVFIYHPLLWFAAFALLFATRRWRLAPLFEGRGLLWLVPVIFLVAYAAFFASLL